MYVKGYFYVLNKSNALIVVQSTYFINFAKNSKIMFSRGQILFAGLFAITFIIVTIISYKKDSKTHKKQYKGTIWVLIGFIIFLISLTFIKYLTKN